MEPPSCHEDINQPIPIEIIEHGATGEGIDVAPTDPAMSGKTPISASLDHVGRDHQGFETVSGS